MGKELLGSRDKASVPHWIARVLGANVLAAALLIPTSAHTLDSTATPFNSGMVLEVPEPEPQVVIEQPPPAPRQTGDLTRDTGIDMQPCFDFTVCGTDLGQPFVLPNGSIGYLFGDTFAVAGPHIPDLPSGADQWRSPVMMRSTMTPVPGQPIIFDNAAGLDGMGVAPEFMHNAHRDGYEISVLPNDGVSLPDGSIIVSYMSIGEGMDKDNPHWRTNYAGLAISHDGNNFERLPIGDGDPVWMNTPDNTDPFQMWSMQLDDDGYVYVVTVRSGRRQGPMMMLRVQWEQMRHKSSYECWNGFDWGGVCEPLLPDSKYGEPSLRKLSDGTWVMSYVDFTHAQLVTRTADNPTGPWTDPKVHLTHRDLNALYGGFIHPRSTASNLIMMVSSWQAEENDPDTDEDDELKRYDVSHLVGTI